MVHVIPRTYVRAILPRTNYVSLVSESGIGPNNQLLAGGACAPAFVARAQVSKQSHTSLRPEWHALVITLLKSRT